MVDDFELGKKDEYAWGEKIYYPAIIMETITNFYGLISQPESDERNQKIISEITKMMRQIEIFEDEDIIESEFKEVKDFLQGETTISYSRFIELLHKIAVVCQRIWYRKGLLLTPVPYKEDIYKIVLEDWIEEYPDKFPEYYEDSEEEEVDVNG